jgi:hypothetical protein
MKIARIAVLFLVVIFFYMGWRTPSLLENHGKMDSHLYFSYAWDKVGSKMFWLRIRER